MKESQRLIISLVASCLLIALGSSAGLNGARASECGNGLTQSKVISLLQTGGFSSVLDRHVEIERIGSIETAKGCLNLFLYTHTRLDEEPGAGRMTKRLLILSNSTYLGSYTIDELPTRLRGNVLEFPGEERWGNKIVFDNDVPPATIYLDGEVRELYK